MSNPSPKQGRLIIAGLVILLMILHQDNWNWDNSNLLLGFMPVTLFYQMCISIGASVVWYMATKIAWPEHLEDQVMAEASPSQDEGGEA